jgi:hypothetical protein
VSAPETPDVERLRAALRAHAATDESVDAGRIFDAVHGRLAPEERQAVVEELLRDPVAAESWRLAQELAPDEPSERPATRGVYTWVPVAAAAMLALALGWQWMDPWRTPETPAYRSAEQRRIASALPEGAPLPRSQAVLKWTAIEGARYRVRVLTEQLQLIEEVADVRSPEYALSPDTLARFPSGARLFWQVEATAPGMEPLVSPTFSARVE